MTRMRGATWTAAACASIGSAAIAIALAACTTGDPAAPISVVSAPPPPVTFHADIEPILKRVCDRCHVNDTIAPFPITSYIEAKSLADDLRSQTQSRLMPPWGPLVTSECPPLLPWVDDTSLTDKEIALFADWYKNGALEGNPGAAPATVASASTDDEDSLSPDALSIEPNAPYQTPSTVDDVECFYLDPQITGATKYLTSTLFIPQNKALVHHAQIFAIPPDAIVNGIKSSDPTTSVSQMPVPYNCFGSPRIDNARLINSWTPQSAPMEFPAGVGFPLDPGTRFIMQVHYHWHHGTRDPDQTRFEYRLTDAKPAYFAEPHILGNYTTPPSPANGDDFGYGGLLPGPDDPPTGVQFFIPKNKSGHTETMTFTFGSSVQELRIAQVGAHMHLAGVDEKISLRKGPSSPAVASSSSADSSETCLMQDPLWRFDWQRIYAYDAPIEALPAVHPGDAIDIRCTYDTTNQNSRFIANLLVTFQNPSTRDVQLGELITDEMCQASIMFLRKAP